MPFPWYHAKLPAQLTSTFSARLASMQRRGVQEHAALLRSLGKNRAHALARCRANIQWEYELAAPPSVLGEIQQIVDKVYGSR
jgi:hypothetical protein